MIKSTEFCNKSGVYIIKNNCNGKIYIGSAVNLRNRCRDHINRLNLGSHRNKYLQNAWAKYSKDSFSFFVLFYCDKTSLILFEQRTIDFYLRHHGRDALYNIDLIAGSAIGRKHSAETRIKIGTGRKGKPHSEETKAMMRENRKGTFPPKKAFENALKAHLGSKSSDSKKKEKYPNLLWVILSRRKPGTRLASRKKAKHRVGNYHKATS